MNIRQPAPPAPVPAGLVSRVGQSLGQGVSAFGGWVSSLFSPGMPIQAQPIEPEGPRAFDFPIGVNIGYQPRREQGENAIDFPALRRVADPDQGGLDLLRLAIETRKDQMAAQNWSIAVRGEGKAKKSDARSKELTLLFRSPDGIHTFQQWQRMLVEDLLVTDAPAIYTGPTQGGRPVFEIVDGATLKRLIALDGRVPAPPSPAFQQIIRGIPTKGTDAPSADLTIGYTTDEILYVARNVRSNRIYGMPPVQQLIGIVNLALRRQTSTIQYYTEGNVPEMIIAVPDTWTPDQIRNFQAYWDALMEGNTAQRRHARFVPGGMQPHPTREPDLKSDIDEWIARIICYCFSLPPTALIKQTNRATAATAAQTAAEEGLEPTKVWFKDVCDELLRRIGAENYEFVWSDEEITDSLVKAQVTQILVGSRIASAEWIAQNWYGLPEEARPDPADMATVPGLAPGTVAPKPGGPAAASDVPPGSGSVAKFYRVKDVAKKAPRGRRR